MSGVDLFPTFLEAAAVEGPEDLDGRSFVALLRGESQEGRNYVFTQIDKKAGGDAVPMRCVQNANYGYIYNPFSDGRHWYRNNNEGKTMQAMQAAARTDSQIAARIDLFRYRVPEELYDLENDPNCLFNLIDDPDFSEVLGELRSRLQDWMEGTDDPMLEAFRHGTDREVVDAVMLETYGPIDPKLIRPRESE